jgi:hypothetical protein
VSTAVVGRDEPAEVVVKGAVLGHEVGAGLASLEVTPGVFEGVVLAGLTLILNVLGILSLGGGFPWMSSSNGENRACVWP